MVEEDLDDFEDLRRFRQGLIPRTDMVFSSLTFLLRAAGAGGLLPGPRRLKNGWLLLFSLAFYLGRAVYVLLMLGSIANWALALRIHRTGGGKRRFLMALAVVLDIGLLVSTNTARCSSPASTPLRRWRCPCRRSGCPSAFPFHLPGAVLRSTCTAGVPVQPRIDKLALYISLFQLIAGPIALRGRGRADRRATEYGRICKGHAAVRNRWPKGADRERGSRWRTRRFCCPGRAGGGGWLGLCGGMIYRFFRLWIWPSGWAMFGFDFRRTSGTPISPRPCARSDPLALSTWFRDYVHPAGRKPAGKVRHLANTPWCSCSPAYGTAQTEFPDLGA